MKKILIPVSALFVAGIFSAQTTNTENYVQSRTYLEAVTSSSSTAKQVETVQYFDGLGRPKQIVNVKASPLSKDVVTHIVYDGFGRQALDYLPVPQTTTGNGGIVSSPLSNATQPDIYGSEKIYAEKIFENSPLDRVLSQKQVGNAWDSKPVTFSYDANVDGEVKKYIATFDYTNFSSTLTLSATGYGANQLYKNTVTDEDGNETIEFKNGAGQVILVRKMLDASTPVDTYYVYNDYNQLAYVIPPLAVVANNVDESTTLANLCYQYKYDSRNRLVEKKLPGKGWEYMVYDKQDRLVLTQDANLRLQNRWLYTKYDQFGRVLHTGISDGSTRSAEQTNTDAKGANNEYRITGGWMNSGMEVPYSNGSGYPNATIFKVLSINFYDTYPIGTPAAPTTQTVLSDDAQNNAVSTKSLPVASYVKNIENDNWTKNYTWYDQKGRAIASHSTNHLGGYTKTESVLDFAGVAQSTNTFHMRQAGEPGVAVYERFEYDHQNRLTKHYHKVDNNAEVLLTENSYNELSQLKNKKVGNNLQSIDYAYNIRGWMTHINKDQMSVADLGGKLFSYQIKYNQKDGVTNPDSSMFSGKNVAPKFNGNIAEVDWRSVEVIGTNPSLTPKRYGYAYDALNRLTAGYYQNPNNPYSKENLESLNYDVNGNITNLYRTSTVEPGNTFATNIDNLAYIYANNNKSNKLVNINDDSFNATGYEGGGNTISYDLNGNMENMYDKGITSIQYNYLSLPKKMVYEKNGSQNTNLDYIYRSDGTKIKKVDTTVTTGFNGNLTVINTHDYLDGFQYLNYEMIAPPPGGGGGGDPGEALRMSETNVAMEMQAYKIDDPNLLFPTDPIDPGIIIPGTSTITPDLQFFPTAEGYYDYIKNQYIYQYKDHLGNARVSFGRDSLGNLEITDANDYYPFGMNHLNTGNANFGAGSYKNYKYNGKELQETGMYDYGARFYMPDIGRWGVVDPLSEKYRRHSTYAYVVNNPVRFIDPDGMQVWPPEGGSDGQTWSDSDGDFVNMNGTWYKDDGALIGFLSGSRYQSVNTKNTGGTPGYDGKTMLPDSSYDYTYDLMPGKEADDTNYWKNGESGMMVSRFLETTGRDATAVKNRTTTIEAVNIVVTTGKSPKAKINTLEPGPYAKQGVPASRGKSRNFAPSERAEVNRQGYENGCHTCGSKTPGTKSGNYIPDHQPANALAPNGTPQTLYPHCKSCSASQGGTLSGMKRNGLIRPGDAGQH